MKKILRRFAPAFVILIFSCFALADDFKSMVIPGDGGIIPQSLPRVHADQFMVIRNFTQEASTSTTRGVVTVTKLTTVETANVLTAAILDPSSPPEIVNTITIAGPADVTVTCGAATGSNCFISFKKDSN